MKRVDKVAALLDNIIYLENPQCSVDILQRRPGAHKIVYWAGWKSFDEEGKIREIY